MPKQEKVPREKRRPDNRLPQAPIQPGFLLTSSTTHNNSMDEEPPTRNRDCDDQATLCNPNSEHTIISALPHERLTCTKPSDVITLTRIINDKTRVNARANVME